MNNFNTMTFITEENVKNIVKNHGYEKEDGSVQKYLFYKASDKMLGFLADYWKLKVILSSNVKEKKVLCFFIKAVSQNASKADMTKEMKLFDKEANFYSIIKRKIELTDVKPWSAKLVTTLDEAIVFEDLNALGYRSKNKFRTFDDAHTRQALHMLARFHASSIIYEQRHRDLLQRRYSINDEFEAYLDKGGYDSSVWFIQCMKGALAAVKNFSRHKDDIKIMNVIENNWEKIWYSALDLSNVLPENCNVVCHRDLWNNNIMFHYKRKNESVPDDCVMVDFQAVRCQPPAGDVMLLLYCNLDPEFRESNMVRFLCYYHQELALILASYDIKINNILTLDDFLKSAEKQRLWALVVSACLFPQIWLDDGTITATFCDNKLFNDILCENKASFIKKNIETDERYKTKVMQVFEEIIDKYFSNIKV